MPTYPFVCDKCRIQWDVKMTFQQHEESKGKIECGQCKEIARQVVVRPNYRMVGEGWFGTNAAAVASPYAITETEIRKNLDNEKRVEDIANNFSDKNPIE